MIYWIHLYLYLFLIERECSLFFFNGTVATSKLIFSKNALLVTRKKTERKNKWIKAKDKRK